MAYFGKPSQCYKCHIEAVYNSWKKVYSQKSEVINEICGKYGYSAERFKMASLLTIAFHDAGKTSLRFQQDMMKARKEEESTLPIYCETCKALIIVPSLAEKTEPYRHEIISGLSMLYLTSIIDSRFGGLGENKFPFEFFAVVGHHKPVNPDSFRREWNRVAGVAEDELGTVGYGAEQWNHVMEVASSIFKKEEMELPRIEWKEVHANGRSIIERVKEKIDTIPAVVQDVLDQNGDTKILGEVRETFALLKSLLVSSDWEGSAGASIHITLNRAANEFWNDVKSEIETEPGKKFYIREFQQKLTDLSGHGIAIAPTGSGKTEGALAWALANKKRNGKILYVLPNQVLTNSIYERLVAYFGEEKVGLLHSGALLYQILNRVGTEEVEQFTSRDLAPTEDERYSHVLNRMMFRPIMVTTVDQLLMTAFNGNKRWSVVMGEVMGGAVIFDEVHAYDGHMLALLERVTRELRDYSKMLFMSATMSANLIRFLSKMLGIHDKDHVIKDQTLLQSARNRYECLVDKKGKQKTLVNKDKASKDKYKLSKETIESINTFLKDNKRVAIVCNTVKTAQDVYGQLTGLPSLEGKDVMSLHSRFIAKDRRKKGKRLEKNRTKKRTEQSWPDILVATQVIECGVDIDYDVLFTEGAPLEAIIQRAGRINRERNSDLGRIYVFKQDENSQKFYPPEITGRGLNILQKRIADGPELTEEDLVRMIEEVYEDKAFENDPRFLNSRRVLDELIYDIGAVQDLPETDLHTRFITYKMVEVIPEEFWKDIKVENQFVIMEHLVKMPLWAYLNAKNGYREEKWHVMDMQYDEEIGGVIKKEHIKPEELLFA